MFLKFFLASSAHQLSASSYGVGSASPLLCAPILSPCLTRRSSRPAYGGRLTLHVSPAENPLYLAHAFSNGIQFLRRYSAPGLPFLRASPAGGLLVSNLFGLWPLRSKRQQLSFFMRCAASVAQCFFAVCARRQVGVSRSGHRV